MNRESVELEILGLAAGAVHGCSMAGIAAVLEGRGARADEVAAVIGDLDARGCVALRHGGAQLAIQAEGRRRLRALQAGRELRMRIPDALFDELDALARVTGSVEGVALLALTEWVRFQKMTRRFAAVPSASAVRVA